MTKLEDLTTKLIGKLNELYITTRRKYLVQTENGYFTLDRDKNDKIYPLNDGLLVAHLKGKRTYGVFSAGQRSKFITFDVDVAGNDQLAKWTTQRLVHILNDEFDVSLDDIHVSFSGNKGYHVDLFFNEMIPLNTLKRFYNDVMFMFGAVQDGDIEFRPTYDQGVKLPLGVHHKTGNRATFVDTVTLEPLDDTYILSIEPMEDVSSIVNQTIVKTVYVFDDEQTKAKAETTHDVMASVDMEVGTWTQSESLKRVANVLKAGRLLYPNSRHNTTYQIALFGNTQGWERDETVETILDVLHNTPNEYFSAESTPELWEKEANRLVEHVYDNDEVLSAMTSDVKVNKDEIETILKVGTFQQKQIAFALLVHNKRFGGVGNVFYMTYTQMMDMADVNSRTTISKALDKLEEVGYLGVVRRNKLDRTAPRDKAFKKLPNKYKLLIDVDDDEEKEAQKKTVVVGAKTVFVEVVAQLFDAKELKKYVARREFENRFRAYLS